MQKILNIVQSVVTTCKLRNYTTILVSWQTIEPHRTCIQVVAHKQAVFCFSIHCFHSEDVGTVRRIECVKSMWISWKITAFQNTYIELFELGHTKRTDQPEKVWTCLHFTLCEVWAKFLDLLHVIYNAAVPCCVLLSLLWISVVSL